MWRKLRKQIAVQREMLGHLLADYEPLLRKCAIEPPDRIELSALAAMLHGFYNGVENVFKRVAIELNEDLPRGEGWHTLLLERMTCPGAQRPAVISTALARELTEFLKFRHFFSGACPFQLHWKEMAPLAASCQQVLRRLEDELEAFLAATQDRD